MTTVCLWDDQERPDWDDYFLQIAHAVSHRADCTRRKVGAVIVDQDYRIVSTGYNGGPAKGPSCLAGECPRGQHYLTPRLDASTAAQCACGVRWPCTKASLPGSSYDTGAGSCIALHAEQNAIVYADYSKLKHATLYITDWPCDGCLRLIKGVGIAKVVCPDEESIPEPELYDGPRRGDTVEAWIKRQRDSYHRKERYGEADVWYALDHLLDNYRLHADTGTNLNEEVKR